MMRFQVITQFPERYSAYVESGLPARAHKKGLFTLDPVQLRDFAEPERRGRVDDAPYGGGPGMVLQIGPVHRALQALPHRLPVILFTPRGATMDQAMVRSFASGAGYTLIAGYYEGPDQRIADHLADHEVSLGAFVLGSGDLPALCFIEAVTRLIPGYVGSDESLNTESNERTGVLEYPQYTRPSDYNGWHVPDVLLSGNHSAIASWRAEESRRISVIRRQQREE